MTAEQEERRKRSVRRWGTVDLVAKRFLEVVRNFIVIAVILAAAEASGSVTLLVIGMATTVAWMAFMFAPLFIWLQSAEKAGIARPLVAVSVVMVGVLVMWFIDDVVATLSELIRTIQ
jgi:hypothetical protein